MIFGTFSEAMHLVKNEGVILQLLFSLNPFSTFMYILLFIFHAISCGSFMAEPEFANSLWIEISRMC